MTRPLGAILPRRSQEETVAQLGNLVRDSITGYEGVVVGKTLWLYGCDRCAVQTREFKDGKVPDAEWFDDQRLVILADTAPVVSPDSTATTGGPQNDPRPARGQ
jgi:hypothetical protein